MQERLGVIIPQEVEIYRELSKSFPQLELFYTVEEGQKQLEKLVPVKEFTNTQVQEEEKEPVITVHNLGKTFSDGFHALIDVNANVAKGKVVAVLGQNGSGKPPL